jgi:hypothetical protein
MRASGSINTDGFWAYLLADTDLARHHRALRLFAAWIKRAINKDLIEADFLHDLTGTIAITPKTQAGR